jgi:hypothetical protein|tara:strand:+ start:345 stop:512 length:168 start_codon:yes stop_codon:yes gene_type:complete
MTNLEIMFWLSIPIYLIGAYTFADWLASKVNRIIFRTKWLLIMRRNIRKQNKVRK